MYKYYKELEDKKNFKTYFLRSEMDRKREIRIDKAVFSQELLESLKSLGPKIEIIDKLIMGLNEDLVFSDFQINNFSYEEIQIISDLFEKKRENYLAVRYDYFELNNSLWKVYYMLKEIYSYINVLILLFPKFREFLLNTKGEIITFLDKLDKKGKIVLEKESKGIAVVWPDAWYITPNGYLYNTGMGHKQGNLVYPLFYDIIPTLSGNGDIRFHNYNDKIRNIVEREYITNEELNYYSNLTYALPTILTGAVECENARLESLSKLTYDEYDRLKDEVGFTWPQPDRSYQKNLVTLIVGHLAAEMSLYNSFMSFNGCSNINILIDQLYGKTRGEIEDILVRFSGFSKISSLLPNTITTSSIKGIRDFREYLDKGWNLEIIPGLVIDKSTGELVDVNLDSPFITRYLEKELNNYDGKGKVLIYRK